MTGQLVKLKITHTAMGIGGDKIMGLPNKKFIVYKNFAQVKASFLLDHG